MDLEDASLYLHASHIQTHEIQLAMLEEIYIQLSQFPIPSPIELHDLPDELLLPSGADMYEFAPTLLPRFSGIHPDKWLAYAERYFAYHRIHNTDRFPYLYNYFYDEAAIWLSFFEFTDWSDFMKSLVHRFGYSWNEQTVYPLQSTTNTNSALQVFDEMPMANEKEIANKEHETMSNEVLDIQSYLVVDVHEPVGVTNAQTDFSAYIIVLECGKPGLYFILADDSENHDWVETNVYDVDSIVIHSFAWKPGLILNPIYVVLDRTRFVSAKSEWIYETLVPLWNVGYGNQTLGYYLNLATKLMMPQHINSSLFVSLFSWSVCFSVVKPNQGHGNFQDVNTRFPTITINWKLYTFPSRSIKCTIHHTDVAPNLILIGSNLLNRQTIHHKKQGKTNLFINLSTYAIHVMSQHLIERTSPMEYRTKNLGYDSLPIMNPAWLPLFVLDVILTCQKFHINNLEGRYRVMDGNWRTVIVLFNSKVGSIAYSLQSLAPNIDAFVNAQTTLSVMIRHFLDRLITLFDSANLGSDFYAVLAVDVRVCSGLVCQYFFTAHVVAFKVVLLTQSSILPLFVWRHLNASILVVGVSKPSIPLLVMGASVNFIANKKRLMRTMRFYCVDTICFKGVVHDMMMDSLWKKNASKPLPPVFVSHCTYLGYVGIFHSYAVIKFVGTSFVQVYKVGEHSASGLDYFSPHIIGHLCTTIYQLWIVVAGSIFKSTISSILEATVGKHQTAHIDYVDSPTTFLMVPFRLFHVASFKQHVIAQVEPLIISFAALYGHKPPELVGSKNL